MSFAMRQGLIKYVTDSLLRLLMEVRSVAWFPPWLHAHGERGRLLLVPAHSQITSCVRTAVMQRVAATTIAVASPFSFQQRAMYRMYLHARHRRSLIVGAQQYM